jgi:hypothetical protein
MTDGDSTRVDANLAKVDHVVVMMLENRSFDHVPAPARQPDPDSPQAADRPLNDLQQRILTVTRELRKRGHPANTP